MAEFTDTYNVNITGVYYTILAFLTLLDQGNKQERKWNQDVTSQVVVVGSIAAFSRMRGASFAYNSSKAGVTHSGKLLSTYLGRWDVRVNVVAPGSKSSAFLHLSYSSTLVVLSFCVEADNSQCIRLRWFPRSVRMIRRLGRFQRV